jgi:HD-GYP domain-containing protein (c-di-GMP phosphodiesterase class II)
MAKPQLSPNLPYKVEESETSQEIQIPKAEPQLSLRSPREVEESKTSQEIQIPMAKPQLPLRPPREVEESSEWIFAHPQHVARYIAGIAYMMQLNYFHCMPLGTLQYDLLFFLFFSMEALI